MRKILAVSLSVLIALPGPALADSCRRVGYTAPVYAHQVYTPPVYHAPSYGHHADVVLKPYAIPFAFNHHASQFYSVAPELAYLRVNKEIAQEAADKAAEKAVANLIAALAQNRAALGPAPNDGHPAIPPAAPLVAAPKTGNKSAAAKVQQMANESCLNCHGKGAKFDLSDVTKLSREKRLEIFARLGARPDHPNPEVRKLFMPRNGEPVADQFYNAANEFAIEAEKAADKK